MNPRSYILAAIALTFGLLSAHADPVDLNSGLVAYFPLDGNGNDASGNGNNGTVVGLSSTSDRFGNATGALAFDKNGYVEINNSLLLNGATSGAITGWFNDQLALGEQGLVIGAGDSRAGLDPLILFFSGDQLTQSLFTETTRGPSAPDRSVGFEDPADYITVPENQWTSFVMQFASIGDTTIFQLYLNGVLAKQFTYDYSFQIAYDQPMPVEIGDLTGFQETQFRGDIDDIRFYDRALNLDEIAALNVGAPAPVPETGVTGLYLGLGIMGVGFLARKRVTI